MDQVDLEFTEDAINEIAKKAVDKGLGARGLRGILEGLMNDVMYEMPDKKDITKVIFDKNTILNKEKPKYILKKLKQKILFIMDLFQNL